MSGCDCRHYIIRTRRQRRGGASHSDDLRERDAVAQAARHQNSHGTVTKTRLSTLKPIRKPIQSSSDTARFPRTACGRNSHLASATPPPTTTLSTRSPSAVSAGFIAMSIIVSSMPWSMTARNSQSQPNARRRSDDSTVLFPVQLGRERRRIPCRLCRAWTDVSRQRHANVAIQSNLTGAKPAIPSPLQPSWPDTTCDRFIHHSERHVATSPARSTAT